jgi:xylose isomerase
LGEKYGVGLWVFGNLADRFNTEGYKPQLNLSQRILLASRAKAVKGLELNYPTDFTRDQVKELKGILEKVNLEVAVINLDLFSDVGWQKGSFSHLDISTREKAIETTKTAMDIAEEIGTKNLGLWLGQDGTDYMFNDYASAWDRLIRGVSEVARYNDKLTVLLEYKHKEPRTHCYISNVGKALYIADEVGLKNVGVVIDVGHALMVDEDLAESVVLVDRRHIPLSIHFNDNYGYWDDDMIVGSVNLWKYVELFYQLRRVAYNGWYTLDIFPYREDPIKAVDLSIGFIDYLKRSVDENFSDIDSVVKKGDVHSSIETVRRIFLKGYS